MWGYGGSLTIHNDSNLDMECLYQHSYQMKEWNPPKKILAQRSDKIKINFNKNPFKVIADDAAEVEYRCGNSLIIIKTAMNKSLNPYFEFIVEGNDIEIAPQGYEPLRHNGNVDIFISKKLVKTDENNWQQTLSDLKDLLLSDDKDVRRSAIASIGKISQRTTIPEDTVLLLADGFKQDNKKICWETEQTFLRIFNSQGFSLVVFQKLVDLLWDIVAGTSSAKLLGAAYHDTLEGEPPAIPAEIMTQINDLTLNYASLVCGNAALSLGFMAANNLTLTQEQIDAISGILDSNQRGAYVQMLEVLGKLDFRHPEPSDHTMQRMLDLTKDVDPYIKKAAADAIGEIATKGSKVLP